MAAQFATDSPHNPLWDFSITLYAKPGVKDSVLALQNDAGMDVLILLADCWLASRQRCWVTVESLAEYLAWRTKMVVPLRVLRQTLGREHEPLRSELLKAELSAEQHAIKLLYKALLNGSTQTIDDITDAAFAFFNEQKKEAVGPLFQAFIDLAQS